MSIDEAIAKQFVSLLTQDTIDEWGNKKKSIVSLAIDTWSLEKKNEITEEVLKLLTVDVLATAVADKIAGVLKESYNISYWNDNKGRDFQVEFKKLIMDKLAAKIADKQFGDLIDGKLGETIK